MATRFAKIAFCALFALVLLIGTSGTALAVSGAISTTDNSGWQDTYDAYINQDCLNGNGVNCNIYADKRDVWFSGLPISAALGEGTYFFAVLDPGGQNNPNDGSAGNLSSTHDTYLDRTFQVDASGFISYSGPHDFNSANNKLQLFPYDNTTNPGGVYILAVCSLAKYPVDPSDCKYDAFKVGSGEVTPGLPLTITKDASGAYDNTYIWDISKSVDKTTVKQVGGSATFNYTVEVSHDGGTISNVKVTGTISVFNPNVDGSNNPVAVDIDSVTDQLSDGTVCTVTDGGAQTLTAFETDFAYSCDLGSTLPSGELDNTATVTWSDQSLGNGAFLAGNSADFTFSSINFAENAIDECVDVSDSYAGTLGTVCVGDANPTDFTYSRIIPVPANDCQSYDNTATFTTNDTGATGSASQTVTVCGPAKTGALTIGFWKTTNGQNLIKTYCNNGGNNLGTYLAGLGDGSGPFSNAPTSCSSLATYVTNVLKGASATNMNVMLKAQMMGTALDVWFSGPGWTSITVNKIKPPSNFLSHNNLGTFKMDTTAVCPMVDNTTAGTATCKNNTPSTDAVKSYVVPLSPMTMQEILDYAATTPAPFNGSVSSSNWFAGNKTKEEVLKNIFDQFNNRLAFGSF